MTDWQKKDILPYLKERAGQLVPFSEEYSSFGGLTEKTIEEVLAVEMRARLTDDQGHAFKIHLEAANLRYHHERRRYVGPGPRDVSPLIVAIVWADFDSLSWEEFQFLSQGFGRSCNSLTILSPSSLKRMKEAVEERR
jgi:hypothetical protein